MPLQKSQERGISSSQRKYLRGVAHGLEPIVQIGSTGVSEGVLAAIDQALADHELIKIKFLDYKDEKEELCGLIAKETKSAIAGIVGHVAIVYREHSDPKRRRIVLPQGE